MASRIIGYRKIGDEEIVVASFELKREIYERLLEIAKQMGGIDKAIERAIIYLENRIKGREIIDNNLLESLKTEIRNVIEAALKESNIRLPRGSKIDIDLSSLGTLKTVEQQDKKIEPKKETKALEDVLEDVIVMAVMNELEE